MKRVLLYAAAGIFLLLIAVVILAALTAPRPAEDRLAESRSLLDAENYLAALETLRSIPDSQRGRPDTHTLLGTAYLRLHLYLAAIKEFESAEKQGTRRADPWIGMASSYIELGDGQKALDEASRAASMDPKSADAWIMLGRAYWLQRDFAEAERAALKAQALEPDLPVVTELLLHIYFDQGQVEKFQTAFSRLKNPSHTAQDLAIRFFVRQGAWLTAYETKNRLERTSVQRSILEIELALKREPGRMELYPSSIRNLVKDGRYEDALSQARIYKGPIPIDLEIGKANWMLGRKDAAIEAFRRSSAGLIHKLSAEVALAILTGDLRHWREAYRAERVEQDYFILAKLEPTIAAADPVYRAFAFRYAGIYDSTFYNKAADHAQKVLDDDPKNLDALLTIGTAYHRLGKIKDAIAYMKQTAELYPKSAEAWSRLASLDLGDRDPNNTLNLMKKAVELDPHNAGDLYNLGWMYEQLGDIPKAIALYEHAIQTSPLTFEAMNNLALIYEQNGQADRAIELLDRAIRVDPELEVGYVNMANHYVRQREWRSALSAYDRVLEIDPVSVLASVEKGRIHIEIGDIDAAVEDLNHALEIDAHSLDAYLLLSTAYEKMNHVKEAIASAEEAERIRPDSPDVKAALDQLRSLGGSK